MSSPHSARRRQQLERAAKEWRSDLIDVSGTNKLLFFKPTAGTLDLDSADVAGLAELVAGKPVRLARLFPDPFRLTAAKRSCKALAAKQRQAAEEYGVAVAFCAFGIATWKRDPDDAMGDVPDNEPTTTSVLGGAASAQIAVGSRPGGNAGDRRSRRPPRPPAAPVLLRALELVARPGSLDGWELTLTGETQLNPVLLHVLAAQDVVVDAEQVLAAGDESRGVFTPIYGQLRKLSSSVAGFGIAEHVLLGAFSYLKQPMVADCEDIEALISADLVAALAGDPDAIVAVRTEVGSVSEADPDYKPVDSEFLVMDADASQSFVVNAALAGRNLVVQGPPGTGKSQTIANIIASLVAHGKRILFVAQKRAAITAVLDRLDGVGLGEVTLDLFAASASTRYVTEQLNKVLDRQAAVGAPVTGALHQSLTGARDKLVRHRDALHSRRHAWGITVADLFDLSRTIPTNAASSTRVPAQVLVTWDPNDLDRLAELFVEYIAKGGIAPDRYTRPGWSAKKLVSADVVAAANQALITFSGLLPAARDAVTAVSAEMGCRPPQTPDTAAELLTRLQEWELHAHTVPGAFSFSVTNGHLEQLLAATDKTYAKARTISLRWGERRSLRKAARQLLATPGPAVDDRRMHAMLQHANAARASWVAIGGQGPVRALSSVPAAQQVVGQLLHAMDELESYLQNLRLRTRTFLDLGRLTAELSSDHRRGQFPRLHQLLNDLCHAGLGDVLADAYRNPKPLTDDPASAGHMLRYVAVQSALEHAMTTDPDLAGIDGQELTAATDNFQRCDQEHLRANAARVRRIAAVRLTEVLNINLPQHLLVKKEVTKKRNVMPVRKLFEKAPDVLTAIKPCWAMSPLQVSQLLPAVACFDVVIFDEASQVKPADAIPALVRAPQVIVAGDSRQLPPTEFFSKVLQDPADNDEDREDGQLDDPDTATPTPAAAPSFTRDAESILFAFDRILTGQSRRLLWHYRSRDERLIAVSNTYVYDGSLTTFPAAETFGCLQHEVVPASPGIKGTANSPDAEVQRVVDLVVQHARQQPGQTLGVITFGSPHANRINATLEAKFAENPEIEGTLNINQREPFFVKNIERVQGDERDSIILSVGYGKDPNGTVKLFWGPLLRPGGERRLNVAISRARNQMTLVTSFAADDIAEDAHPSAGFMLMYRFLRFMGSGGTDLSRDGHRNTVLNAFEIDIRDRLTVAGLHLTPQLGVGSYRLDFGARHPQHPGRYVLAIEADGASYHSGHIARERDRLRQRLLEARGWKFHRIWSTDWFHDADTEVSRAVAAFNDAVAHSDAQHQPTQAGRDTPTPMSWHIASTERRSPMPAVHPGMPVDKYAPSHLRELVEWVRSDGVLRTEDEELSTLIGLLGFYRRGTRIVTALKAAQHAAR